jgi:CheY-like chemotaxis protein
MRRARRSRPLVSDEFIARRAAARARPSGPPRILLVDDDEDVRFWLRTNLGASGWTVAEATNGDEALELHMAQAPDVVVLDERMPGKRGLEVARDLRRRDGRVRLLMFSASVDRDVVAEAAELDVHFVSKVDHDGLLRQLELLRDLVATSTEGA